MRIEFYSRIRKTGNSFVVTIPKFLIKAYNIKHRDIVKVVIEKV